MIQNMLSAAIILFLTAFLVLLGYVEFRSHVRNLDSFDFRIHVNGTRGKSSVTRLISAGLRAADLRTCAKTTGTMARMIMPDGAEFSIYRPTRANIIEQVRIVRAAAGLKARALVIECMALQPLLQWLSEEKLVRATHGVITNVRADHLDVMGPGERDVALAMAAVVPRRGKLFTCEDKYLPLLSEICRERETELIAIAPEEIDALPQEKMDSFGYIEHRANVALALKVCEDLGLDRQVALEGMTRATPDPGALTAVPLDFFGRRMIFVNGFAANDPESSERIWNMARENFSDQTEKTLLLFNCRLDRIDRTRQLAEACAAWQQPAQIVLMGDGTYHFARLAGRAGIDPLRITIVENRKVDEIFESIIGLCSRSTLIVGLGNIGGQGLQLVRFFQNRSNPNLEKLKWRNN